jgi:hypothetical protein
MKSLHPNLLYTLYLLQMKAASLNEIKQELLTLPPKKVLELCLRLTKFKKENKELLSFLLFEAHDEQGYVESIKKEINDSFWELPRGNMYIIKKGLRKILRAISKYSKHTSAKESEVEMLIHFCRNLQQSGIYFRGNKALSNLYDQQLKKLHAMVELVHEDLRFDYKKQLGELD